MIVLKFGGTSVGTSSSLANVKKIVESLQEPAIVVVSALGGLTDRLIATAKMAAAGDRNYLKEVEKIEIRHYDIIKDVIEAGNRALETAARISPLLDELRRLYDGVSLIGDLPVRTLDRIVSLGERMSSVIVADMIQGATHHHSPDFIKTEKWFDKNIADTRLTTALIVKEFEGEKAPSAGHPAVLGGFISSDRDTGEITNLGRGGSDYTAALVAAALDASVLQIWTDVDGFMTADPRIIPGAHVIPKMSFVESMDLCTFGAKVIYPPTIYPVFHKTIPIRILNTFRPEVEGTFITDARRLVEFRRDNIAGITSLNNGVLLTLRSRHNTEALRSIESRSVNILSRNGISVMPMSRGTLTPDIALLITGADEDQAIRLLKEEFAPELVDRTLEVIESSRGLATVAVVGDGILREPDLKERIAAVLRQIGVMPLAFSAKSSETTLSFVIKECEVEKVLKALHHCFFGA